MSNEEIKKTNRKPMQNNPNESKNSDLDQARWANAQSRNQTSQSSSSESSSTMRSSDVEQARQANAKSRKQSFKNSDMEAANGLHLSDFEQANRMNAQESKADSLFGRSSSGSGPNSDEETKKENEKSRQNHGN